jgi:hypothetical protein
VDVYGVYSGSHRIPLSDVPGREDPVIFEVNYATLVDDNDEYESLVVPFDMMKHGIKVDMVPPRYGGTGGITVEGELLPYCEVYTR